MILHHQSALDMSREAQERAEHQELKDLAGRIVTQQEKEIAHMQELQSLEGGRTKDALHVCFWSYLTCFLFETLTARSTTEERGSTMKLNQYFRILAASVTTLAIISCSGRTGEATSSTDTGRQQMEQSHSGTHANSEAGQDSRQMMDTAANEQGEGMSHDMTMGTKAMSALDELDGQEFDVAFMSQMIAHHQGAVEMAEQTLQVAQRPETRQEAQKVIDAQTKEIAQMTGWLKDWYSAEPSMEQQKLMQDDMADMMAMRIEDDPMFYDMMIPHHQGAIEMSELAQEKAQRPELKNFAGQIKKDQNAEILKYRELAEQPREL